MTFLDIEFWLFIAVTVIVNYILPRRARWVWLLAASIAFYCSWGYAALGFVGGTTLAAYLGGMRMRVVYGKLDRTLRENAEAERAWKNEQKKAAKRRCRAVLWLCILLMVGVLVLTKVSKYLGELSLGGRHFSLLVPLGISYYTLSLVGYLCDVFWRKQEAERNPLKLLLFAVYFPKILQGPITRYGDTASELFAGKSFSYDRLCKGLQRFVWGYFKKLVIADRLNLFVVQVFGDHKSYGGSVLAVAAIFGAFQLYCDFSGCMDIALGVSSALGVELAENFNHPFLAETAAEFWRRWHITLGAWFKDYIYMPLVVSPGIMKLSGNARKHLGKRAGKAVATIIPLAVVWLLTGLWHGTGANYVAWGIYWGLLIILGTVLEPEMKRLTAWLRIDPGGEGWQIFRRLRTFALFVFSRIITIPGDLHKSLSVCKRILLHFQPWSLVNGDLYKYALNRPNFILALLAMALICWVDGFEEKQGSVIEAVSRQHIVLRWLIYYGVFFGVMVFGIYGPGYDASAFVYMNY